MGYWMLFICVFAVIYMCKMQIIKAKILPSVNKTLTKFHLLRHVSTAYNLMQDVFYINLWIICINYRDL